jgi:hypothetical protein
MARDGRLRELGYSMASDDPSIPLIDVKPRKFIPAGYTYFGQFIAHDLIDDPSGVPLPGTTVEPEEITNHRALFLNLDTLYGEGPRSLSSRHLYEEDGASFRVGAAPGDGQPFDVPVDGEGKPQAADYRNLENAIVRQINAMLLQLHNLAVEEIPMEAANRFSQARERVCHQFQWLVRNDFIPSICNEATLDKMASVGNRLIDWEEKEFSIPVEFAHAAFRFGHSMVRAGYPLGGRPEVKLAELFGGRDPRGALPAGLVVDWDDFFAVSRKAEYAHPIDTCIVRDLFRVPTHNLADFRAAVSRDGEAKVLPLSTLNRGAAARLCSGQIAKRLLCPTSSLRSPSTHYSRGKDPVSRLAACGLQDRTPLWFYILMEAELDEAGNRLGTLGSHIVAGTIEAALWSNPNSYLRKGPQWQPAPWKARDGSRIQIKTFHDVARAVGLAKAHEPQE